jgi:hypothetical protein
VQNNFGMAQNAVADMYRITTLARRRGKIYRDCLHCVVVTEALVFVSRSSS